MLCALFDISTRSYYEQRQRNKQIDVQRSRLRIKVKELFHASRNAAGSRTIVTMMQEQGYIIGRFKVRRLMRELGFVCKQPGSHAYKTATVERPDIPNHLQRSFDVPTPNTVWCGDITYIWAGNRWHYLAVIIDLHTRRVVGWALSGKPNTDLTIKALDMAYQQRGRPHNLMFHSDSNNVFALFHCVSHSLMMHD